MHDEHITESKNMIKVFFFLILNQQLPSEWLLICIHVCPVKPLGIIYLLLYTGFEPRWGQTIAYAIGIFSTKHAALRSKSKDWIVGNQDTVSEWSNMFTHELLFQWPNSIKIIKKPKRVGLVQSGPYLIEYNMFLP